MSNLHEECGVFGVCAKEACDVAGMTYYGLFALQHRGQRAAASWSMTTASSSPSRTWVWWGEVFNSTVLQSLGQGNMAVGHVRYGTTGTGGRSNAQPMLVNHIKGRMALAHNGNLTNSTELRTELELQGSIFHSTSDTEVISYIITKERIQSSPSRRPWKRP